MIKELSRKNVFIYMVIQKKTLRKHILRIMHLKLYKLNVLIPIEREQPSDEILHETNPN